MRGGGGQAAGNKRDRTSGETDSGRSGRRALDRFRPPEPRVVGDSASEDIKQEKSC